jgi:hypothetical protein
MRSYINVINQIAVKSNSCTGLDRPWGFHEVEAPGMSRKSAHENGKFVSPTNRLPLPPGNISVTNFW